MHTAAMSTKLEPVTLDDTKAGAEALAKVIDMLRKLSPDTRKRVLAASHAYFNERKTR